MFHIGASEAPLFAETVEIMTNRAKELGPSPLRRKTPVAETVAEAA
jgi:coenzyme F420-reducing hydrogenase delta subunit